jgi:arylsulfatase A-like enzyme
VSTVDRPNVLLVLTDQQRPDWIGSDPDVPVRTPVLCELANRGVHFTNAVCPAPLCAPSRTCLASGMEYDRCGIQRNEDYPFDHPTLYDRLRDDGGYETIGVGDIDLHMGSPIWGIDGRFALDAVGFDNGVEIPGKRAMIGTYRRDLADFDVSYDGIDEFPPDVGLGPDEPKNAYMAFLRERGLLDAYVGDIEERLHGDRPVSHFSTTRPAPVPQAASVDDWVGRQALDHLDGAPEDRPWFLAVNFVGPHEPMDVTESMHGWYRDPDVEFPEPTAPDGDLDSETHQAIRRNYAAMCENVDRWLGRLLDAVDDRGERDETIVVFASDHGELLGDHGGWTKLSPLRASSGVPLVVAGPGVEPRGRTDEPVSLIDLHATVLDYAGVDPGPVDSRSLRPYLDGGTDDHRDVVRSGVDPYDAPPWRLVFDGRYELIVGQDLDAVRGTEGHESPVLFDLETDPDETTDVAANEPEVVNRLGAHLPDGFDVER